MTTLGKIFVILNLVASLVVGAFLIMVYIARTKLEDSDRKKTNALQVASARIKLLEQESNDKQVKAEKKVKELEERAAAAENGEKAARADAQKYQDQLAGRLEDFNRGRASGQSSSTALKSMQEEVDQLQKTKEKLEAIISNTDPNKGPLGLLAQMDQLRQGKVQAEIQRDSLKARNGELQTKFEEMAKQLVRLQAGPSTSITGTTRLLYNPPQRDMEGQVLAVDRDTGYLTLSIGSDSDLTKGHTLELFRLGRRPAESKYLGTLEILKVGNKNAIARPVQRLLGTVEVGDQVASRITDG